MTNKKALTLQEIHEETLYIFRKIVEICDLLEINYYITFGTLIGAIRHKGFIPWDDDFDIMMLRADYDKFVTYCNAHEKELKPYRLMNQHNTEGYTFAISRFCDLDYEMVMDDGNDYGMGMFIDVYPMDGMGVNPSNWQCKLVKIKRKILCLGLYYSYKSSTVSETGNLIKKIWRKSFCIYARMMGTRYFISELDKLAARYTVEESNYLSCVIWGERMWLLEKEWFEDFVFVDFEGMKVKAPSGYDEMLKCWYGDYMQLPPENMRAPHHGYSLYRK